MTELLKAQGPISWLLSLQSSEEVSIPPFLLLIKKQCCRQGRRQVTDSSFLFRGRRWNKHLYNNCTVTIQGHHGCVGTLILCLLNAKDKAISMYALVACSENQQRWNPTKRKQSSMGSEALTGRQTVLLLWDDLAVSVRRDALIPPWLKPPSVLLTIDEHHSLEWSTSRTTLVPSGLLWLCWSYNRLYIAWSQVQLAQHDIHNMTDRGIFVVAHWWWLQS